MTQNTDTLPSLCKMPHCDRSPVVFMGLCQDHADWLQARSEARTPPPSTELERLRKSAKRADEGNGVSLSGLSRVERRNLLAGSTDTELVKLVARAIAVPEHHTAWDTLTNREKILYLTQAQCAIAAITATRTNDPSNGEAVEQLLEGLRFYANPEVYKPSPHGLAFDDRDLSWKARNVLADYAALSTPANHDPIVGELVAALKIAREFIVNGKYRYNARTAIEAALASHPSKDGAA